jgi:cytochrome c oxidase assembly protein Cox11
VQKHVDVLAGQTALAFFEATNHSDEPIIGVGEVAEEAALHRCQRAALALASASAARFCFCQVSKPLDDLRLSLRKVTMHLKVVSFEDAEYRCAEG